MDINPTWFIEGRGVIRMKGSLLRRHRARSSGGGYDEVGEERKREREERKREREEKIFGIVNLAERGWLLLCVPKRKEQWGKIELGSVSEMLVVYQHLTCIS